MAPSKSTRKGTSDTVPAPAVSVMSVNKGKRKAAAGGPSTAKRARPLPLSVQSTGITLPLTTVSTEDDIALKSLVESSFPPYSHDALGNARDLGADVPDDYYSASTAVKLDRTLANVITCFGQVSAVRHLSESIQDQVTVDSASLRKHATAVATTLVAEFRREVNDHISALNDTNVRLNDEVQLLRAGLANAQNGIEDFRRAVGEGQADLTRVSNFSGELHRRVDHIDGWLQSSDHASLLDAIRAFALPAQSSVPVTHGLQPPSASGLPSGLHGRTYSSASSLPAQSAALPASAASGSNWRGGRRAQGNNLALPAASIPSAAPALPSIAEEAHVDITHRAFRIGPCTWAPGSVKKDINSVFKTFRYFAGLNEDFQVNLEDAGTFARVSFISNAKAGFLFKKAFDSNQSLMPPQWVGSVTVSLCAPRDLY